MDSRSPAGAELVALSKSDLAPLQGAGGTVANGNRNGFAHRYQPSMDAMEHAAAGDDFAMQLIQKSRRLRNVSPLDKLPQNSTDFLPRDSFADALSKEPRSIYSSGHSDIVTEVPIVPVLQPETPKGSPPQSSHSLLPGPPSPGPTHYQEVLQQVRDAPPEKSANVVRVRGAQGYAWEQDTEVATKYVNTRDATTPREPFKPWEPPPIPDLAVTDLTETSAVDGRRDLLGRGAESLVRVQADISTIAEAPAFQDRLQKERLQFKGLFGVFYLTGGDYVISAVLRGGQLSRKVLPGDKLVSIDGQKVGGLDRDQVRHLIDGEVGTEMKLDFVRAVGFSVTVLRTDTEMADIQAGTSEYLLSVFQMVDAGEGEVKGQHADEGEHMNVFVRKLKEILGKRKEDTKHTIQQLEQKITQQAIEMNRSQENLRADSQRKEEEMKDSVKAMEDKVKELQQTQQEQNRKLQRAADEKVKQAEEKAKNDKMQMQTLLDVRKEKAELEMQELRKVAEEHQKVIDMQVAQNKEEFDEKARLLETQNEAKLAQERERLKAQQEREMEDFQKHVQQQTEAARNQEMGAKLQQERATFEQTLQVQKKVHEEELEQQQQQAKEALQLKEKMLRKQMEAQVEKMRLDFEKHLRGVASSGPAGQDIADLEEREDVPDEAVTELAGFMRAEFVKMRETAKVGMEAKLTQQQEEFHARAREYEERLTRDHRQKADEIEALQHKYALANDEQLRVQKEVNEQKFKMQEARFEQMMAELRSGHQNRIENMEHGFEEILATLRSEIDEMRAKAQMDGEREMGLHTTITELQVKLEEASSQGARDFERLGLQHREEVAKIEEEHRVYVERLKVESSLLEQKLQKQESAHQIKVQHEIQKVRVEEKEEAGRQQALAIDRARLEFTQDLAALNAVIEDQKQKLIQFPELAEQVNYMNEHDLVGMSLVMTMDPNVLNEKDGRRAVRRRFVDQLEIAASTGPHRLVDIGARPDKSKKGVVFDILIHPKSAYDGFISAGAAQHKAEVLPALEIATEIRARVLEARDRGQEGLKLDGFESGRVCECKMINVYELIHVLKDTILFMDGQLQRANGQPVSVEPPDPRSRTAMLSVGQNRPWKKVTMKVAAKRIQNMIAGVRAFQDTKTAVEHLPTGLREDVRSIFANP